MTIRRTRARTRQSRGQALVEFALIVPVLFLIIFGIIEAGRFIFYYHSLNNAIREGVRYAIVHGSNARDGCPSGPPHATSPSCDPSGQKVREAVSKAAFGLMSVADLGFPPINHPDCTDGSNPCYYGPGGKTNARGNTVVLFVTYTYPPVLPLLPPITISAESSLVINN